MPSILVIYTGGTIGMKQDSHTGALVPFNFRQILSEVPELHKFGYEIHSLSFTPLIDSSDATPAFWSTLAHTIEDHYEAYDGFVVLIGTDTMAYTASALSFMLDNLEKPVIFTGSQLPIGMLRTDGKENFISAIEIAAAKRPDGRPQVPEVCVFFENQLFRGNRTTKYSADQFRAFRSPNLPSLAQAGIHISYNNNLIRYPQVWGQTLKVHDEIGSGIAIIKLFPGIQESVVRAVLQSPGLRAIILETYGSGNAPSLEWLLQALKDAIAQNIIIFNITQCLAGCVSMETYAPGSLLKQIGVLSGHDMTTEAAIAKMILLTGLFTDNENIKPLLTTNLKGEISIY